MAEGSETFVKKTSNRFEGGFPKALEQGPYDVAFKNVAHLYKVRNVDNFSSSAKYLAKSEKHI